jgi:hypothetical protein
VNLTDVHTGWVFTRTVRNNAYAHILTTLRAGVGTVPFAVAGLDFDNGTEFLNKAVIRWAAQREIFFTRSRPYKKNDQATIKSKNNHLVRKYGFYYRYDTAGEHAVLVPSDTNFGAWPALGYPAWSQTAYGPLTCGSACAVAGLMSQDRDWCARAGGLPDQAGPGVL